MWDYEYCKTCSNNGKVCDECMQCGEYGTSYYQGIRQEEERPYHNDLGCVGCAYSGNRFRVCSFCVDHNKFETNLTFGVDDHTVISEIKKIMSRQFTDETNKISYEQALDGMKSEYPTGKELDAFLEYKRDKKEAKNDIS